MHFFFDTFEAYQSAILALGSVGGLGLILIVASDFGRRDIVRVRVRNIGNKLFWAGMICALGVYAGIKPPQPHVTADTGLSVSASYGCETNIVGSVTNYYYNSLNLAWTYSLPIVAGDALYVEKRQHGLTESTDWEEIYHGTAADSPISIAVANATNYEYFVYTAFVQPDVEATNGVYHLNAVRPSPDVTIPLQSAIIGVDGSGATTNLTEASITKKGTP